MGIDDEATVLRAVRSSPCSIRALMETLHWKTSKALGLIREMEEEGLIEFREEKGNKQGRPRKVATVTPLGEEFLKDYKRLEKKRLKARKTDLQHATRDAQYVDRLVEAGQDTFKLFLELNDLVRCIGEPK